LTFVSWARYRQSLRFSCRFSACLRAFDQERCGSGGTVPTYAVRVYGRFFRRVSSLTKIMRATCSSLRFL
jgi:hypothetical protein